MLALDPTQATPSESGHVTPGFCCPLLYFHHLILLCLASQTSKSCECKRKKKKRKKEKLLCAKKSEMARRQ